MTKRGLFLIVQVVFWGFVIAAWMKVYRQHAQPTAARVLLSRGGLACASFALLFTTAMTAYVRVGQRLPYDRWESRYLFYTTIVSFLGIALASVGKTAPRLVALFTSIFTLLIAFADAVSY